MLKDCWWCWGLWSSLIKIISKYQTSRSRGVCLRPVVLFRCHRDYDTQLGKESSLLTPERWARGGFGHWLEGRVLLEVWFPSPFHHAGVILLLTQRSPVKPLSSLCPRKLNCPIAVKRYLSKLTVCTPTTKPPVCCCCSLRNEKPVALLVCSVITLRNC